MAAKKAATRKKGKRTARSSARSVASRGVASAGVTPGDVRAGNETPEDLASSDVIAATRAWIERAVIGLNLCPFAKGVYLSNGVSFVASDARTADALLGDLERELRALSRAAPEDVETTVLIHPHVLTSFFDYNDFLDVADAAIDRLDLTGILQIASFHPDYQFAGTAPDDVTNYTNRSPYPMLHLLREESVERAVDAYPGAELIPERNIETMLRLGLHGLPLHGYPKRK